MWFLPRAPVRDTVATSPEYANVFAWRCFAFFQPRALNCVRLPSWLAFHAQFNVLHQWEIIIVGEQSPRTHFVSPAPTASCPEKGNLLAQIEDRSVPGVSVNEFFPVKCRVVPSP